MGIKIGDISPLAGMVTGKGMFGKLSNALGYGGGLINGMLADRRDPEEKKKKKAITDMATDSAAGLDASAGMNPATGMKKGGKVKKMASGGSASKRADGCATKGKTRGKFV